MNETIELPQGCIHKRGYLNEPEQVQLFSLVSKSFHSFEQRPNNASASTAQLPGSAALFCYGKRWDPATYKYEATSTPIPGDLLDIGNRVITELWHYVPRWEAVIANRYEVGTNVRLPLHRDESEDPELLSSGSPVLIISLGMSRLFILGGLKMEQRCLEIRLSSGDVFVMGGPSRLRYHGVKQLLDSGPSFITDKLRISLTFRQVHR